MSFVSRLLVFAALLGLATQALAHNPEEALDFDARIRHAGLVFVGKVARIEYRKSTARGPNTEVLPHTFVTYSIERILKGKTKDREITLRFLGGRGDGPDFYMIGEYPMFDVGDVDVLMVKKNGVLACPLVNCRDGRFRSIDGKMYSELGKEILLDPKKRTIEGRRHALPDVTKTKISKTTLTRRSILLPGEEPEREVPKVGTHFVEASFVQHVASRIAALHTPDQLRRLPIMASADPAVAFSIKAAREAPARRLATAPKKLPRETPAEKAEREAYERGGENPVLN